MTRALPPIAACLVAGVLLASCTPQAPTPPDDDASRTRQASADETASPSVSASPDEVSSGDDAVGAQGGGLIEQVGEPLDFVGARLELDEVTGGGLGVGALLRIDDDIVLVGRTLAGQGQVRPIVLTSTVDDATARVGWAEGDTGTLPPGGLTAGVATDDGTVVAVGIDTSAPLDQPFAAIVDRSGTAELVDLDATPDVQTRLNHVMRVGSRLVAIGTRGGQPMALTSDDGRSWTSDDDLVDTLSDYVGGDIEVAGSYDDRAVVVLRHDTGDGTRVTSALVGTDDGWKEGPPVPGDDARIYGVALVDNQFIAVGETREQGVSRRALWRSGDALAWTPDDDVSIDIRDDHGDDATAPQRLLRIATADDGTVFAAGYLQYDYVQLRSTDAGRTWTEVEWDGRDYAVEDALWTPGYLGLPDGVLAITEFDFPAVLDIGASIVDVEPLAFPASVVSKSATDLTGADDGSVLLVEWLDQYTSAVGRKRNSRRPMRFALTGEAVATGNSVEGEVLDALLADGDQVRVLGYRDPFGPPVHRAGADVDSLADGPTPTSAEHTTHRWFDAAVVGETLVVVGEQFTDDGANRRVPLVAVVRDDDQAPAPSTPDPQASETLDHVCTLGDDSAVAFGDTPQRTTAWVTEDAGGTWERTAVGDDDPDLDVDHCASAMTGSVWVAGSTGANDAPALWRTDDGRSLVETSLPELPGDARIADVAATGDGSIALLVDTSDGEADIGVLVVVDADGSVTTVQSLTGEAFVGLRGASVPPLSVAVAGDSLALLVPIAGGAVLASADLG